LIEHVGEVRPRVEVVPRRADAHAQEHRGSLQPAVITYMQQVRSLTGERADGAFGLAIVDGVPQAPGVNRFAIIGSTAGGTKRGSAAGEILRHYGWEVAEIRAEKYRNFQQIAPGVCCKRRSARQHSVRNRCARGPNRVPSASPRELIDCRPARRR
jgi:hypothetical protein